jgi:hypothetical protein
LTIALKIYLLGEPVTPEFQVDSGPAERDVNALLVEMIRTRTPI